MSRLMIAATLAAVTGLAAAQQAAADPSQSAARRSTADFSRLDKDQDGVISKREAGQDSQLVDGFQHADENKDGKLDAAEFSQLEMDEAPTRQSPSQTTTSPSP